MGHPVLRDFRKIGIVDVDVEIHTKVTNSKATVDVVYTLFNTTHRQQVFCTTDTSHEMYSRIRDLHEAGDDLDDEETMEHLRKIRESF